jgi:hypothetical protein
MGLGVGSRKGSFRSQDRLLRPQMLRWVLSVLGITRDSNTLNEVPYR